MEVIGKVRVICTRSYHHGDAEWLKLGHHYLDTVILARETDSAPCILLRQGGVLREQATDPLKKVRGKDGLRHSGLRVPERQLRLFGEKWLMCPCKCGHRWRMSEAEAIVAILKTWDGETRRGVLDIAVK